MKTTYVVNYQTLDKLKLNLTQQKQMIDYFFNRKKMIRWDKSKNKFTQYFGLIDISFVKEFTLTPDEAKPQINLKNIQYLVNRTLIGEYFFGEANETGEIYRVIGENVKEHKKIIDEYHIVFNTKIIDKTPPFTFKTVFYGNIFDYLEQKNIQNEKI